MFEIITQINDLIKRVGKLESLETPFKSYGLWANRPTAPFDGQRFFATDSTRRIEYEWDNSASNWFSVTLYKQPFIPRGTQPFAQAQTFFDTAFVDYAAGNGVYITKISANVFPVTAQSGTNFYTLTAGVFDTSGVQTAITLTGSNDTKAMTTANSWRPLVPTFTPVVIGNTNALAFLVMTPTAAPGTFFLNASIQYRLIG